MADLSKTIQIVLNGQDKASQALNQVSESMGKMQSAFGGIAKVGASAAAAIAAVGAGVTALVGAGLKQAYDQSVAFESAMTDLEKVLGSQPDLLDEAKRAALELSSQYGVSATDITDSIAGWVQAGYDLNEASILAEESLALVYASELDTAAATETLTKIMKGFGLEVGEARGKLDAINEISNNYAANAGQLSEALSKVGPIAQSMGISLEEMAAILTPAIEKFQDGSEVGNAYRTVLNKLVDDSKPVQDALEALGVNQKNANGELRSGRDILFDVGEAFNDLKPSQQTFIAQQIAGIEQSAKFLATMGEWDNVSKVYTTAMESAGSITEEVKNQLESSENIIKVHRASWENLSTAIGDQYNEAVDEVITGSTLISAALRDSISEGDFDELFDVLNDVFNQLAEQLKGIAEALPEAMDEVDWSEVQDTLEDVADAFGGLFDDLDLTRPDELAQAIQGIVDTGSKLITFFGNVVTATGPFIDIIIYAVDVTNQFFDILGDISGPADVFKTAIGMMLGVYQKFLEALDWLPGLDLSGPISEVEKLGASIAASTLDFEKAEEKAQDTKKAVEDIPDEKKSDIEVDDKGTSEKVKDNIDGIPDRKAVGISIDEDDSVDDILAKLEGEQDVDINVDDKGSVQATKEKIEETIPPEKRLEIEADIKMANIEKDIAEIEAQAETMQTAMEWTAKVDIARAEASMEKYRSSVEATSSAIESTAGATASLFSIWLGAEDATFRQQWAIEDAIEQQMDIQEEQAELQAKLIKEQIKMMQARRDAMEQGDGLIQIDAQGLEPELEAFMWKIIERVQVRANEEASEFLLGINS
jgi:TP901 family phage tail tape measure protein